MEKPMLQPINPVLPAIAADPYNINVAMPTVDPIGTEQRIEQINQMRAAQAAQRQQLRQGEMSIENQRQQLAQQAERFALEKQKYQDEQLKALDTYRSDAFKSYDQLTNLPIYNEEDRKVIDKVYGKYGIKDLPNVLNSDDKVQIQGALANMQKALADPDMQNIMRKSAKWETIEQAVLKNPNQYDLGKVRALREKIGEGGISSVNLDNISLTDFVQSTDPTKVIDGAIKSYVNTAGFPTSDAELAAAGEHVMNIATISGVSITPEQVDAMFRGGFMSPEELTSLAGSFASEMDLSTEQVLPFIVSSYKAKGPAGVNEVMTKFREDVGKIKVEETKTQGRLNVEATKAANRLNLENLKAALDSGAVSGSRASIRAAGGGKAGAAEDARKKQLSQMGITGTTVSVDDELFRIYGKDLTLAEARALDNFVSSVKTNEHFKGVPPGTMAKMYLISQRFPTGVIAKSRNWDPYSVFGPTTDATINVNTWQVDGFLTDADKAKLTKFVDRLYTREFLQSGNKNTKSASAKIPTQVRDSLSSAYKDVKW